VGGGGSNTSIYLSLSLHKERPSYRRSLQLSREAIQHFKTKIFFYFCGSFFPPGSGSRFRIRIRIHWPDWIRIQLGSGSATLVKNNLFFCSQHLRVVHKTLKSGMTKQEKCPLCHQDYYDLLQHQRRAHKVLIIYLWSASARLVPGSILVHTLLQRWEKTEVLRKITYPSAQTKS
jgi:hypothetical protein